MKKIRLVMLVCGFFMINLSFIHANEVDSIQQELIKGKDVDSAFSYILKRTLIDDSNAIAFTNIGLEYAIDHNLTEWQVVCLIGRSRGYKFGGKYSESLLDALEAVQIIDENVLGIQWRSQANSLASFALAQIGAYNEAIEIRKSQLNWALEFGGEAKYLDEIKAIGKMYYQMEQYDSANTYNKKLLLYAERNSLSTEKGKAINNIGLGFMQLNDFDSAKLYFERAHKLFNQGNTEHEKLMASMVGGNLSQCYVVSENTELVKQLLTTEISESKESQEYSSWITVYAYLRMAILYDTLKNYNTAITYIDSAYQLLIIQEPMEGSNIVHLEIIELYIDLLDKVNDSKSALIYARKYMELYEGLYGDKATKSLNLSKVSYQVSGIQRELKLKNTRVLKLEKEEQLSKLKIGLILAIGISVILIALIIILKMNSDHKKKKVIEEYSKQILEKSIESKNQMLTQTMLNLTRKKEFSQELLSRFKSLDGGGGALDGSIQMFITNEIKMDESLLGMDKYISQLDKDFFTKLKLQFPQLSANDVKLCGLIRMDLSNKELAIIMNITVDSMKTRKTRMSRKMDLPPGTILFESLKKI